MYCFPEEFSKERATVIMTQIPNEEIGKEKARRNPKESKESGDRFQFQ